VTAPKSLGDRKKGSRRSHGSEGKHSKAGVTPLSSKWAARIKNQGTSTLSQCGWTLLKGWLNGLAAGIQQQSLTPRDVETRSGATACGIQ
jgi:hypothetical protein